MTAGHISKRVAFCYYVSARGVKPPPADLLFVSQKRRQNAPLAEGYARSRARGWFLAIRNGKVTRCRYYCK